MTRWAYVNGDYLPIEQARVSVLDRGFLFADGIYEVTAVVNGRLVDMLSHLARLDRSVGEIGMTLAATGDALVAIHEELIHRNALDEGVIYLQATRGAADRDFVPLADTPPTLVLFTQTKTLTGPSAGIAVKSLPDIRWARRDIKSVALLAQVLAKREAAAAGCQEAWMIEDGFVTEGASSTAWILTREGILVTRAHSHATLPGCTALALNALLAEMGLTIERRPFTLDEAFAASEAFVSAASSFVQPVNSIDGRPIGEGRPGPIATRLRELYVRFAREAR
ncbi:MAG: D-amino-acid transaminase [Sphingomonas bacterium]|nr:D-amino-acid transaminase [Sphingomonas bacterium]